MNPKVSVIIPCYNVSQYIDKCLRSVLDQTWTNIEVICVNDGSTDATLEILESYSVRDDRIIIVDQVNRGLSAARNAGLERVTGLFVMFVDSDDWINKECIAKTINADYDLVCFSYNRIFKNRIQPRVFDLSGTYSAARAQRRMIGLVDEELNRPDQANSLVTAWAKIYRTHIIKNYHIRFVDTKEIGTEDALFNIKYLDHCTGDVLILNVPYYNYVRYNESSLTTLYKASLFSQWQRLHEKMLKIIEGKNVSFENALYNRIALSIVGLGLNEIENPAGIRQQLQRFQEMLYDPLYEKSFRQLIFEYFPVHWKILFMMAKHKNTIGVFMMMKVMSYLWKRKNK